MVIALIGSLLGGSVWAQSQKEVQPFTDIADSYARTYIMELHDRGIIDGVGNGTYAPHSPVTRAEFVTMVMRVMKYEAAPGGIPAFTDVPPSSWSYRWVQAAVYANTVSGVAPGRFAPDQPVTREEAAALLARAFTLVHAGDAAPVSVPFADGYAVANWARGSVAAMQKQGIMTGDNGYFRPADTLTREELAVLMHQVLEKGLPDQPAAPEMPIHLGWQYDISDDEYKARVTASGMVNTLSPRWFFLDAAGVGSYGVDKSLSSWAKANGKQLWPLVGNRFSTENTHKNLSDAGRRGTLVHQLAGYAKTYGLAGLNIDFENIDPADRTYFTAFIRELGAELHRDGRKLSVDVPPDLGTDWSDPYDFAELAHAADYLVVMAYNEHWSEGKQIGSNASLPWVRAQVEKLLTIVPRDRLIVALPLYTMQWEQNGKQISSQEISQAAALAQAQKPGVRPVWDASAAQYTVRVAQNGTVRSMWLEESRSLSAKYEAMRKLGVAGVAFWYIGGEENSIWPALRNAKN